MMLKQEIEIGGLPVEIIRKSNLKNLYVRVNPPDGKVKVSSPTDVLEEEINLFVLKKLPEITKIRNQMLSQDRQSKREYVSGESHYLWGRPYRLQVVYQDTKSSVLKTPTKIILTVPERTDVEGREKIFTEWYRQELKRVLDPLAERCEEKTGIHVSEYRVKNMRTKWGTCNIDKRRIWINLQLVKKPIECLEYVVIHEQVHLLEKNHTNRFHSLVGEFCPNWKDAKKLLSELPLDYMEKGDVDIDGRQSKTE